MADDELASVVRCSDAATVMRLELSGSGCGSGFASDGGGEWMSAKFFSDGGHVEHLRFGVFVAELMGVCDFGLAEGERAGFVEDDGVKPGGGFEMLAALDEDAGTGGTSNGGHDGRRRGEDEGAGTGDDEDGDGAVGVVGERKNDTGKEKHDGDEPAGKAVESALDGCVALLGGFNESGNPGEGSVFADASGFDEERAGFGEGAYENFVAGMFFDGHAFAGNEGLIDGGFAGADNAVSGDAFAGTDEEEIAGFDFGSGNFDFVVASPDAGGGRDE